jgi:phage replication-related protein YjqB (UPF0714/DUF867 family)
MDRWVLPALGYMNTPYPEYSSFAELAKSHTEGPDFRRVVKPVAGARVAIIAPHGGRIEPHTDAIATTLAGTEFSLYCFNSRLSKQDANLHVTSHRFDDPVCLALIEQHNRVVAVHGWRKEGEAVLIGGLDLELVAELAIKSRALGVETHTDVNGLAGSHSLNICNRGKSRRGVQLELTMALRKSTKLAALLVAFRNVLLQHQNAP